MRDLATSIREYYDAATEPVEAEEIFARLDVELQPQRRRLRPLVVATAAAIIVFASVGAVALFGPLGERSEIVDEPPVIPAPQSDSTPSVIAGGFNNVHSVAFGPDGDLWAATSGGVVRWNLEARTPMFFTEADGLQAADVTRIDVAADGTVWVGSADWVASYDGVWTPYTDFGGIDVGPLGDFAAGPDGTVWFWADMSPEAGLLRHDAAGWTAVPAPEDWLVVDDLWGGQAFSLDVAPDGTVWVGSDNGVLAYDGESWTHHTVASSTLPSDMAWWVAAAPDGTIWMGTESFPGDEGRAAIPSAGVSAFDGTSWSTFTTNDGLAANEAKVAVGPDGTVWALHEAAVTRFDGDRWTSFTVEGGSFGATVGNDGSLWRPSPAGITQFDGSVVTTLVVPLDAAPTEVATLILNLVGEPTATATPLGRITWYRFTEPEGHFLHDIEVTPYGLIANDLSALRWSSDLATWNGYLPPIDPWRLTPNGNDLISHSAAAIRLVWDGTRWVQTEELEIEGSERVEQIVFGDHSTIITVRSRVLYSTNRHDFVSAEHGPNQTRLLVDWIDEEEAIGCYSASFGGWPGEGSIGPVLADDGGFVAMTPAHPANWNNEPWCEPVLWYSRDGRSWELLSTDTPFGDGAVVYDVASHGGRHVAVGTLKGRAAIWISDDAIEWTTVDLPDYWYRADLPESLTYPTAVAGADFGWVLIDEQGAGRVSADGVTWVAIPDGMPGTRTFWQPQSLSVGHGMIAVSGTEELVFGVLED